MALTLHWNIKILFKSHEINQHPSAKKTSSKTHKICVHAHMNSIEKEEIREWPFIQKKV